MTTHEAPKEIVATNEIVAEQGVFKIWQPGQCHCGAVKFEVLHEPLYLLPGKTVHVHVISCNCSICLKNGYLFIYPERHEIKWESGWDTMKSYRFLTETKEHRFCGTCGSSVAMDWGGRRTDGDLVGINVSLFALLKICYFHGVALV